MKTNGATWKAYIASWPDHQWFDDSDETYDGREPSEINPDPEDAAVVKFSCGVIYANENDREGVSLTSHFRKWLTAQTHAQVVVSVPKEKLAEFGALLESIGAKEVQP